MSSKKRRTKIVYSPLFFLIWLYQKAISPLFPSSCIYYPSCSEYARQAFIKHGLFKGAYLSITRLLRCHPFHTGGVDEVPETFTPLHTLKNG